MKALSWAALRTTDRLALLFVIGALGFGVWHARTRFFGSWTPNLGVACLEIAVTIAVVDRIVRREAERQLEPLRESALDALGSAVRDLVDSLQYDINLLKSPTLDTEIGGFIGRPLAATAAEATELAMNRVSAASREIDEARIEMLEPALTRSLEELERRLGVDRHVVAPTVVTTLEEVAAILRSATRRPSQGRRIYAYASAQDAARALTVLADAAEADPDVASFVRAHVDAIDVERWTHPLAVSLVWKGE